VRNQGDPRIAYLKQEYSHSDGFVHAKRCAKKLFQAFAKRPTC